MTEMSDGPPLLTYASMVWRRRWLVLIIAGAMAVPAYVVAVIQPARYQATGEILLSQPGVDDNFNFSTGVLNDTQVNSLIAILDGDDVAAQARGKGGTGVFNVTGSAGSNVLALEAQDNDPRRAAGTVTAYAQAFSDYLVGQKRQTLSNVANQLQSNIDDLENRMAQAPPAGQTKIQEQIFTVQEQLGTVKAQEGSLTSGVIVVKKPNVPQSAISPTPIRNALLALVLAIVLGVSISVLLETTRTRKITEDAVSVERWLNPSRSSNGGSVSNADSQLERDEASPGAATPYTRAQDAGRTARRPRPRA